MGHICHAAFCGKEIPAKFFMCREEWYSLPKNIRDAVWREYVKGQEKRKDPTRRYLAVFFYAIAVQAFHSGHPQAVAVAAKNLLSAQRMRLNCVEKGYGDPLAEFDPETFKNRILAVLPPEPAKKPFATKRTRIHDPSNQSH